MPPHHGVRDRGGRSETGPAARAGAAVETIEPYDREPVTCHLQKLDDAHGDRIRPRRRAQREGAALLAIVPWLLQHEVAARAVHPVKHHKVAAGFETLEAFGPAGIDLDRADGLGF